MTISKYPNLSFLIFLIFSLSSCENFFNTTLDLDPPPYDKSLVIDCVAHTGQDTVEVRISRNAGILENVDVYELALNDAEVFLTINGSKIVGENFDPVFSSQSRNNYRFVLPKSLNTNDKVVIEAMHKDFVNASSTLHILPKNEVLSATFNENGGLDRDGDERSKVTVKFKDEVGKNFYAVQILAPDWNSQSGPTYLTSLDPSAVESFESTTMLLSDDGYDGKEKIIEFQIYRLPKEWVEGKMKLVWYNISEDYYKYSRSLLAYKNTVDNPFGTPVPVTTNINGGTGIFAIHNYQIIDVK